MTYNMLNITIISVAAAYYLSNPSSPHTGTLCSPQHNNSMLLLITYRHNMPILETLTKVILRNVWSIHTHGAKNMECEKCSQFLV